MDRNLEKPVHPKVHTSIVLWLSRLCIGLVFFFNVQCAVVFLTAPGLYSPSFELSGIPGEGMVRGLGILFLMWNVPYAFALWHPFRFRLSLLQAGIMQTLGVVGETLLWFSMPSSYSLVRSSVLRFIIFDAAGLVLLLLASWLVWLNMRKKREEV